MIDHARQLWSRFRAELAYWRRVWSHPRTPRAARWLLGLALAYAVNPVDLVPDFLPVVGHLDDVLIVPLLVWLACRLVPAAVLMECRSDVAPPGAAGKMAK